MEGEAGVLLSRHICVCMAVKIKVIAPRFEVSDRDGNIAPIVRENVGVVHGIARGIAPNSRRVVHYH